jgi:hypothetical protein
MPAKGSGTGIGSAARDIRVSCLRGGVFPAQWGHSGSPVGIVVVFIAASSVVKGFHAS